MYVRDGKIYNEEDTPKDGDHSRDILHQDDRRAIEQARGSLRNIGVVGIVGLVLLAIVYLLSSVSGMEEIRSYLAVAFGAVIVIYNIYVARHNGNVRRLKLDAKRRKRDQESGPGSWYR